MSEERLQEIKDSVEFQYTLAKAKGLDNALLFTDEEKELIEEVERLNNIINELGKLLEEEQDRLARETSNIYEDSLGKTRLVNENIYEEVQKIKDKLQELKGSDLAIPPEAIGTNGEDGGLFDYGDR